MTYQQLLDTLNNLPKDSDYLSQDVTAYVGDGEYLPLASIEITDKDGDHEGILDDDHLYLSIEAF